MFKNFFKNKEIETALEAVKNNPDNIIKLNILGKLYLKGNFYNEAISVFEKILRLDEKYLPTLEILAKCYMLKKQYLKAFRTLKLLCELVPEDMQAKTLFLSLENAQCDIEAKIEILKGLLEFEDSISLNEKLGEGYFKSGQFAKSAVIYEKLTDIEEKPEYLIKLSVIYEKTSKFKKAAETLEKLMLTKDFSPQHAQKLAEFYTEDGRFDEAKEIYELLMQSMPENTSIYNEKIAKILLMQENPEEAISATRNAINEDQYSIEAKFLQAQAFLEKKDYSSAIAFLREFYCDPVDDKTEKKIVKEIVKACILQAQFLREEKKFTDAIDALIPAMRYDDSNKEIYIELARISTEIRDYSAAKEYMKIADSL